MKKRTLALMLCVALFLTCLTACGDEPQQQVGTTTTTTADTTTTSDVITTKYTGTTMTFAKGPTTTTTTTKPTTTKATKPKPTVVNGIPVPKPAYDDGCTKLAFWDDFDSIATFDFAGKSEPGKNWYGDSTYNASAATTRDYSVKNGILAIEPTTTNTIDFTSYARKIDKGYTWHFGYAECRMRFDTEDVPLMKGYGGTRVGWPSFWGVSVIDYMSRPWTDSGELDVMEGPMYRHNNSKSGVCYSGAIHHHVRVEGGGRRNAVNPNAMGYYSEDYRIDSNWHTYGALWREGYVAWYMDGEFMHSVKFEENKLPEFRIRGKDKPLDSLPSDTNWIGAHTPLNKENLVITVGGGDKQWPMYVDWVRVWEYEN